MGTRVREPVPVAAVVLLGPELIGKALRSGHALRSLGGSTVKKTFGMRRAVCAVPAALLALLLMAPAAQPASADQSSPQNQGQLDQQLSQYTDKVHQLSDQLEHAQGRLDQLNRQLGDDRVKEAALSTQMQSVARLEYQRPALTLSTILQAGSLDELVSSLAQARLVARKQQTLYAQAKALREKDSTAREGAAREVSDIAAKRNQAAALAGHTQSMLRSAQTQAQQQQAQALNQYAQAAASRTPAPGSGATVPNTFVAGQCTWYVANQRNIPWSGNAIDWWPNARAAGFAEGPTPEVGAVMVTRESGYGHVALVQSVSGSSWTVTEMNYRGPFVVDSRTLSPGQAPVVGFIYGKAS